MDEIKVMEKPEWVSWDDIHELILAAHKKNIAKGIVMQTTSLSGEEISKYLGEEGKCFVAFCDNKLIGTTSVRISQGHRWYDRGKKVAKVGVSGVLQKYQGLGVFEELTLLRDKYISLKNVQIIEGDTPEDNKVIRRFSSNNGFKEVGFFPAQHQNHFSVYFVKWLEGCPFSDRYIKFRFNLSRFLTKLHYKEGKIERNKLLSLMCKVANSILVRV